ncbi:MAG: DNA polymerase III subunit epsilon [Proteobacteria bacterium]|nr:DNA polymerase III subunit epsilon [Pseudomonadota bacterium]
MRQIILDTETTGLETTQGHRIIEIGCVELVDRRITKNHWHRYINPEREIDPNAFAVHGISKEFLLDKPRFRDISDEFLNFISGAELIIHNAEFDLKFLNYELGFLPNKTRKIQDDCRILDTLALARKLHPGKKNNLDALCKRYKVDNSSRNYHGALLDAEILALVYLAMTSGQDSLFMDETPVHAMPSKTIFHSETANFEKQSTIRLPVIGAKPEELALHDIMIGNMLKQTGRVLWNSSIE